MDKITLNFWALFYLIASAQGIFVSLLLLTTKKGKKRANLYLSILVFILSVYLFDLFLGRSNLLYVFPHLVFFAVPLWYLFAPLTYFYIKSIFDVEIKLNGFYLLHFIAFLVFLVKYIPFYLLPPEVKVDVWANRVPAPGGQLLNYLYALVAPVQILCYSWIILRIVKHRGKSATETRLINEAHFSWLKFVFTVLLCYAVLRIGLISQYFLTGTFIQFLANMRFFIFSAIIYSIAYFAVIEPERIFPPQMKRRKMRIHITSKEYARRLTDLVEREQLYLNSDLKYTELSQRLNISARYLTDVLNNEIGASFNDFINSYRVEEVKKRMLMPEYANYSLLALALDSGFSSKSSFNRVFKKHTGVTPSEFLTANKAPAEVPAIKRA